MHNLIWIKSDIEYYKLIKKIYLLNIPIYEIKKDVSYNYFKIKRQDLSKLKKYLPYCNFKIDKELGLFKLINTFKNHYYYFIALFFGLLCLFFLSNVIVKVEVIHSSKEIRDLLYDALDEEGIRRLSLKKDYEEISKIKDKILNKYQDDLEWIEIEVHGMKYVIRVEQRIITKPKKESDACNIVASRNGIITNILTTSGEALVVRGNYVNKGDILISGNVKFNEEVKNTVCASGSVKAEVWYTVKVSMPLSYKINDKTGKKRYNIVYDTGLGKTNVFRDRLKNYYSKDKKLLSILGTNIYFRTMNEYIYYTKKYTPEEAYNAAVLLALEKINIKKNEEDKIITQKVLKKDLNDSTINLEIFFAIEEEIGIKEVFHNSNEVE